MSEVIFCDQCNGENVAIKKMDSPGPPNHRPMTDLIGAQMENGQLTPTYYGQDTYVAICCDCGNKVEWSA